MVDAWQVAAVGHRGDGHNALDTTPGRERGNDRGQTPGRSVLVACLFQTRPPCRGCIARANRCVQDHWLSRGGTDDVAEPSAVGWAPGGAAGSAHIVPQPQGFQPKGRRLEVPTSICTRAAQVADGLIFHGGAIDGGEVP